MNVVLYQMQGCPFCDKVRRFVEDNGLQAYVEYRDIEKDNEAYAELQGYIHKSLEPCLIVDNCPIVGSDEVIHELRALFLTSKAG